MKTLWYTGCSMTRGDEIADQIIDPDFFNCDIWNDEFDYNSSIVEKMGSVSWKSTSRKDKRLARLQKIAIMAEADPLKFDQAIIDLLNRLKQMEENLCWPNQIAQKLGYNCIHDGDSAASAGVEFYRLLKDINNQRDIRIIAWTYPYRLTYWGKNKFLRYPPGWQPMHISRSKDDSMTKNFFDKCFDNDATVAEWIESVFLSATILEKIGKPWYFTFGSKVILKLICENYPEFLSWVKKYEDHILSHTVFTDQYAVTDHLTPKAMYAGHPRVESHNILAEQFYKKIKDDISNN